MKWYHFVLAAALAYGLAGIYLTTNLLGLWSHPLKFWRDFKRSRHSPKEFCLGLFNFSFGVAIVPAVLAAAYIFRLGDLASGAVSRRRWKPRHINSPR